MKPEIQEFDIESLKREIKREIVKQKILDSIDTESISFAEYWQIFEKNALILILLPIVVMILGWLITTDRDYYESNAVIFIHGQSTTPTLPSNVSGLLTAFGFGGVVGGGGSGYLGRIMESQKFKQEVFRMAQMASYPNSLPPKDWRIVTFEKDGALKIAIRSTIATLSQKLVQAHLEALDLFMRGPAKKKRMYIEKQLASVTAELEKYEQVMKEFQETYYCVDFENYVAPWYTKFYSLKDELFQTSIIVAIGEILKKKLGNVPELVALEIEKIKAEAKKQANSEAISEIEKKLVTMPGKLLEYKRLERNLKLKEKLYGMFAEQFEIAKISQVVEESHFEVIEEPLPGVKVPKKFDLKIIGAGIITFFLVLAYIIFDELRKPSKV